LLTSDDLAADAARWEELGRSFSETVDLDQLFGLASMRGEWAEGEASGESDAPLATHTRHSVVAVARDRAFCFYYPENLELLAEAGGTIVPFSPLSDDTLPAGTELLYLGGGYPELQARLLAKNEPMRRSIRRFHADGGTIYAECGGLMYAGRELVDASGQLFPMLDLLPTRTVLQPRLAALGYVTWRSTKASPLGPEGTVARGHEYHYSRMEILEPRNYAAIIERDHESSRPDGLLSNNLLAGYAHLHFGSNPGIAAHLLGRYPA